jgi:hypothetical protein
MSAYPAIDLVDLEAEIGAERLIDSFRQGSWNPAQRACVVSRQSTAKRLAVGGFGGNIIR